MIPGETIRLLIVDDHRVVAKALATCIANQATDIALLGAAHDGEEAVEKACKIQPDVVLMDLAMPHIDGVEATRRILAENPRVRVLAFTGYTNAEQVFQVIQAGAGGVYFKGTGEIQDLCEAIRSVARGETVFPDALFPQDKPPTRAQVPGMDWASLTPAEFRILDLAAKGYSDEKILALLGIKEGTYRNYRRSIREKLGVEHWHQAIVAYYNRGASSRV